MSVVNTLLKKILGICYYLPYVIIGAVVLGVLVLLIDGRTEFLYAQVPFLIALVVISVFLILNRKKIFNTDNCLCQELKLNTSVITSSILIKLFWIVFSITFLWILLTSEFNLLFLILLVILYILFILQIFIRSTDGKNIYPGFLVFELVMLFGLHVFSTVFSHPYYDGWTDIPIHLAWIQSIINDGAVTNLLGGYENFCLFHIETAEGAIVSGMPAYTSMYLTATPLMLISTVFVYGIARRLTNSAQFGVLAAFFYVMIPQVIWYAIYPMPRMHATIAFLLVLFLFYLSGKKIDVPVLILAILSIVYMNLVHNAQVLIIVLMMTGFILLYFLYRHKLTITRIGITAAFYIISLIGLNRGAYNFEWMNSILTKVMDKLPLPVSSGAAAEAAVQQNVILAPGETGIETIRETIFQIFGSAQVRIIFEILIAFILITGVYHLLSPKLADKKIAVFGLICGILAVIFIPGVFDSIEYIVGMDLELDRIRLLLASFFAIVLAAGALIAGNLVSGHFQQKIRCNDKECNKIESTPDTCRLKKYGNSGVIAVMVLCVLMVIISPVLTESADNSAFDKTSIAITHYFTDENTAAFSMIETFIPQKTKIHSDYDVQRYYQLGQQYTKYGIPVYPVGNIIDDLFNKEIKITSSGYKYILLRNDAYSRSGSGILKENAERFRKNTANTSVIYNNKGTILFTI
ncbi:MAG TPA: hypothetical protein O0X39_08320 [Methanocorpusculum sp.]|nr:hypothetical protein [Methanocorpusculum sp.]